MMEIAKDIIIHTHISDALPKDHPLANSNVKCNECGASLHAAHNECMQTWYETDIGNFCTLCYRIFDVMENHMCGLPPSRHKTYKKEE